jgi:hypothetical protein
MKFSRRLGCVGLALLALSCTDRRERLKRERQRLREQEKKPYVPPRLGPISPGVTERAKARLAARQEAARSGKLLTILYSGNLDGEYEAHPLGGFARRATLIAKNRAESERVVYVDGGDSLLPRIPAAAGEPMPDPKEVDRRLELMASAFGRLRLDAFNPGENELAIGTRKLKLLAKKAKIPLISANLTDARGKLLFEPYRIIETPGLKVGIFGITTLDVSDTERLRPLGIAAADAVAAAQSSTAALKEKGAEAVIGMFHVAGGISEARRITRQLNNLNIMVLGHSGRKLSQRMRVNREDRYMLEAHRRGRILGKMDLRMGAGAEDFKNGTELLDSRYASDPEMQALLDRYIAESQRRVARKLPVGLTGRAGSRGELATAEAEKWTYASSAACARCHPQAAQHFATTAHATALATLERKGRQRDPECLICHSTGFDRPGGTHNLATAATFLGGVGCESCHGPSAAHVRAENKTGTTRAVTEGVCKECHTPEQSPEPFDYATAVKQVLGKGHGDSPAAAATPRP